MRRRIAPIALGCGLALGLLAAGAARATVGVRIDSPAEGAPVFGRTEIKAELFASEPVVRVEFYVNGKLVGTATTPPWTVTFDAGDENIKREIKVVVYGSSGVAGSATRVSQPLQIDDTMDLKLQQLFITVNRGEHRALDLDQGDFRIADNGKTQQIVTFGKGELPLTAMLLLDTSESMKGERLEGVRRGATAFLQSMKPLDEAALVMFSDRLLRITPFSEDKKELAKALTETEAAGGTAVNDFLYMSLKLLEPRLGRRVVILLSDGADVHSVMPMSDVLWKARTSQAMIYWIQLEGGEKHHSYASAWRNAQENDKEYDTLEKAVVESGGRIQRIDKVAEIEGAFRGILQELREQYVIGYYPSDVRKDGRWHDVSVNVQRAGVRVRTRDGYVDF
jgi:Ca-activated chloride channel family protein